MKKIFWLVLTVTPIIIAYKLYSPLVNTETHKIESGSYKNQPTITVATVTPFPSVTRTPTTKIQPVKQTKEPDIVNGEWAREVDGKTTWSYIPEDDHMSTPDELFAAVNAYRRSHALPELIHDSLLCQIAQNRANELLARGSLDGHEGMDKYAHEQQSFDTIGEVLYGGVQKQSGTHIVEYGWDRSLTGHRDALQNREYTHGCGGIAGYFAQFTFGGGHI